MKKLTLEEIWKFCIKNVEMDCRAKRKMVIKKI